MPVNKYPFLPSIQNKHWSIIPYRWLFHDRYINIVSTFAFIACKMWIHHAPAPRIHAARFSYLSRFQIPSIVIVAFFRFDKRNFEIAGDFEKFG